MLIFPTLALNSSDLPDRGLPLEVRVETNVVEAPDWMANVEGERLELVDAGVDSGPSPPGVVPVTTVIST